MEHKKALEKAHSSQVRIEKRDDRDVLIKSVDARERKNEIAFHALLHELGLPSMNLREVNEELVIDFIEGAKTLGDVETVENYQRLGEMLRALHSKTYLEPFLLDDNGNKQPLDWQTFLSRCISTGKKRQEERGGFSESIIDRMREVIQNIPEPKKITPIHGDLHGNNVLLKNDQLYLFDKADQVFAGDPLYDLSLFGITLPGIYGIGSHGERDIEMMKAFVEGYGEDFMKDRMTFDRYVLLRSFERWPNPFETEIPMIVERILKNNK